MCHHLSAHKLPEITSSEPHRTGARSPGDSSMRVAQPAALDNRGLPNITTAPAQVGLPDDAGNDRPTTGGTERYRDSVSTSFTERACSCRSRVPPTEAHSGHRRDSTYGSPAAVGAQSLSPIINGSWTSSAIRVSPCSATSASRVAAARTAASSRCDGSILAGLRAQPLAQATMSG